MEDMLSKIEWSFHKNNFIENLQVFCNSTQFTDVTLVCDGKQLLQAHKIVLSACSPVFKDIFSSNQNQDNSIIFLDGINFENMQAILNYMYYGEAMASLKDVNLLKDIAQNLKIHGMKEMITEFETESSVKQLGQLFDPKLLTRQKKEKLPKCTLDEYSMSTLTCSECLKVFASTGSLTTHFRTIHQGMRFTCEICDEKFNTNNHRKIHIQWKHQGITYPCDYCDQRFVNPWGAKNHIASTHEGKRYDCSYCERKFTQKGSLRIHMETAHLGVKYGCSECTYTTPDPSNLNKHVKNYHMNKEQLASLPKGRRSFGKYRRVIKEDVVKVDEFKVNNNKSKRMSLPADLNKQIKSEEDKVKLEKESEVKVEKEEEKFDPNSYASKIEQLEDIWNTIEFDPLSSA